MKTRTLIAMAAAAVVTAGIFWQGALQADLAGAPKVGVVDVTRVLENSQRHKAWQQKMEQEQAEARTEFEQLRQELETLDGNIQRRTRGSEEYIRLTGEFMQKKAMLDAKTAFYEDKVTAQMQRWTEDLYQVLMRVVERVAQQKGIDLVLATEQVDMPAPSLRDFMLTIKTKKILYSNSKLDITAEVLAALDNEK